MIKRFFNAAVFFTVAMSFAQKKQSHYKSEISLGNGYVFSTFFDVSTTPDGFTIISPKDADVRIVGGKARLGRLMGKSTKHGVFITITGEQKNDSLFGEANVLMMGKMGFKGLIKNGILSGAFSTDGKTTVGTLHGVTSAETRNHYNYLYPILIKTIEDNIYSKYALKNKEWSDFKRDVADLCADAHDDIELYFRFNMLTQDLPFTHTGLAISHDENDSATTADHNTDNPAPVAAPVRNSVVFEEKNTATAYLLIKDFAVSQQELAVILPKIVGNTDYKNLIVDLRDNPGGGIEAAFEFANYITREDLGVGYFLTNKLDYAGYEPEVFNALPELQPKGTEEFINQLKATSGARLIFKKPDNAVFTGAMYILTNGGTGSTCEPMVYALKKNKRAVIIGEKTRGAMLAACPFVLSGKYSLMLPIADFYTTDGARLDKVGVTPDIAVKSEDALAKALEMIAGKS